MKVVLNGELLPIEEAKISVLDRGFLFGDGLYEVIRKYEFGWIGFDLHWKRMLASAHSLGFSVDLTEQQLLSELDTCLDGNNLRTGASRITITRGVGKAPNIHVHESSTPNRVVFPLPIDYKKQEAQQKNGCKLWIVDRKRNPIQALSPAIKSGNYLNNLLAITEAEAKHADDAVLCNMDGWVAEGSTFNIFIVKNGIAYTPPLSAGILDGITRKILLRIEDPELPPIEEKLFTPEDVFNADEVFLTSTIREVLAVVNVNNKVISDGQPGTITRKLFDIFHRHLPFFSRTSE